MSHEVIFYMHPCPQGSVRHCTVQCAALLTSLKLDDLHSGALAVYLMHRRYGLVAATSSQTLEVGPPDQRASDVGLNPQICAFLQELCHHTLRAAEPFRL